SNLSQASSQRQRWIAGRLQALRRVGGRLFASRSIGWRQKLDVVAELVAPGPALHLAYVTGLFALLVFVTSPAQRWIAISLRAWLLRPLASAFAGLMTQPDPLRSAGAFAYLPIYAVWRLAIMVKSLDLLRRPTWVRTGRADPAGPRARPLGRT